VHTIASNRVELTVEQLEQVRLPEHNVVLVQALGKGNKIDDIVRDATELGVESIVPVMTERTVVRLSGDKLGKKQERLQRIAEQAARQSGRISIPTIREPLFWEQAIASIQADLKIVLSPHTDWHLRDLLLTEQLPERTAFAVGPEGGFSEQEVSQAEEQGWLVCSLGDGVLRTETVAAAVLGAWRVWCS
jgi:16S rRNA (uracil1498-N3)-methyltransferase